MRIRKKVKSGVRGGNSRRHFDGGEKVALRMIVLSRISSVVRKARGELQVCRQGYQLFHSS